MSDLRIILCTFPNAEQARAIGTQLVEQRLAACVNLIPGIESIYRWQGLIETSTEVLAVFKTTASAYPVFEKQLCALHPYEVPEIIALEPDQVVPAYARWVMDSVVAS